MRLARCAMAQPDDEALLPASTKCGTVDLRGRIEPQPDPEVDQGTAQLHAALTADHAVAPLAGRLVLDRVETGRAVDLTMVVEPGRVAQRAAVVPGPDRSQPGTVSSGANGVNGSSRASWSVA